MKRLFYAVIPFVLFAAVFYSCAGTKVSSSSDSDASVYSHSELRAMPYDRLESLSESGNVQAMRNLAARLQSGSVEGLSENEAVDKALFWWQKAGEAGDTMSFTNIALMYEHKAVPGAGNLFGDVPLDYSKAVEYLTLATEGGDMKAPRHLGLLYEEESGTDSIPTDESTSFELYRLAAERGDSTGTMYLADYLLTGRACTQDVQTAVSLYEKIVDSDEHDAGECAYKLAGIYSDGIYIEKNEELAQYYHDIAVEKGFTGE